MNTKKQRIQADTPASPIAVRRPQFDSLPSVLFGLVSGYFDFRSNRAFHAVAMKWRRVLQLPLNACVSITTSRIALDTIRRSAVDILFYGGPAIAVGQSPPVLTPHLRHLHLDDQRLLDSVGDKDTAATGSTLPTRGWRELFDQSTHAFPPALLVQAPNLVTLRLHGFSLQAIHFSAIRAMTGLVSLHLDGIHALEYGLDGLVHLTTLILKECNLDDVDVDHIGTLTSLQHLTIIRSGYITSVLPLTQLPLLITVHLRDFVSVASIEPFVSPHLTSIKLEHFPYVPAERLKAVETLPPPLRLPLVV